MDINVNLLFDGFLSEKLQKNPFYLTFHNLALGPVCKQFLLLTTDQTHYYYKSHDLVNQHFLDHQKLVILIICEILLRHLQGQQDNEGYKNIH